MTPPPDRKEPNVSVSVTDERMKPVIILPKGAVSAEDIAKLGENGICCIEAEAPEDVRFMEPPPNGYTEAEKAAIALFRFVMKHQPDQTWTKRELGHLFAQMIISGTPLEPIKQVTTAKGRAV